MSADRSRRPASPPARVVAIVAAGGSGRRLGLATAKPYVRLGRYPLCIHALRVLQRARAVDRIIVVAEPRQVGRAQRLIRRYALSKVAAVVAGGATRTESVRRGLDACDADTAWVVIHDAARPFVTARIIAQCLRVARRHGAAVCAVACSSTIKSVGRDDTVTATLDRKKLWEIQTPQIFRYDLLASAYARAGGMPDNGWYDDASLVEQLPHPVRVVRADARNMKITTREDLHLARLLLRCRPRSGG